MNMPLNPKEILIVPCLLFLLNMGAQVQSWDIGYNTNVERVLHVDANFILISGSNSFNLRTVKYLARFDKVNNGFSLRAIAYIRDTIWDHRIINDKLVILGQLQQDCDFFPGYMFIETISLDSLQSLNYVTNFGLGSFSFLTDSTLICYEPISQTSVIRDLNLNTVDTVGYSGDSPTFIKTNRSVGISFIQSQLFGVCLLKHDKLINYDWLNPNSFHHMTFANWTLPESIRQASFFSTDSICFVTNDSLYVTDTSLNTYSSYQLPTNSQILLNGSVYYAINGKVIDQYGVSNNNHMGSMTLNITSPRFKVAHLNIIGNDSLFIVNSAPALHNCEIIPVNSLKPTVSMAPDVQMDSLVIHSTTKIGTSTSPGYWSQGEVYYSNRGIDTIFEVLLSHRHNVYPGSFPCYKRFEESLNTPLAPGEQRTALVTLYHTYNNASLCAHLSIPNNKIEQDISNNSACAHGKLNTQNFSLNNSNIYPNPLIDHTLIVKDLKNDQGNYEILSPNGASIFKGRYSNSKIEQFVTKLTKGVYFLVIKDAEGNITGKASFVVD